MNKLVTVALCAVTTLASVPGISYAQKVQEQREDSITVLRARINRLRGQMTEHEYTVFAVEQARLEALRIDAVRDGMITPAEMQLLNQAATAQARRIDAFVTDFNSRSARRIR